MLASMSLEKWSVVQFLFCETGSHCVAHPASASSWVLGLQARTKVPSLILLSTICFTIPLLSRNAEGEKVGQRDRTWHIFKVLKPLKTSSCHNCITCSPSFKIIMKVEKGQENFFLEFCAPLDSIHIPKVGIKVFSNSPWEYN